MNDELSKLLKYKVTMESGEFDFIPVGAGISSVRRLDNLVYATYTSTKSDGGISGKISFSVDLQTGKVKLLGSNQPSKGSKLPNSEFAHLKDETAIRAEYATINSKIRDIENRGWGNEKNEDYLARMNEIRNLEARRTRLERYATEKGITLERLL